MSRLLAFDTSFLFYRAFHGLPTTLRAPDGTPVNAVRGLLDAMAALIDAYRPDLVACAWDDDWRPAWRVQLIDSYKAHRVASPVDGGVDHEETPDELAPQIPIIRAALAALGIAVDGSPGFEADDVLATLAARHPGETLIATGDRDLFQLVGPATRVVWVGRAAPRGELVDESWLLDRYGVPADRYVDFAVLRGDPSDGLPGVKGVGEKSAARLVGEYGSLDELLAAAVVPGRLSPALARNLTGAADYVRRARLVVRTADDVPLRDDVTTALPHVVDPGVVTDLRSRLGLGGSVERLAAALAGQRGEWSR